MSTESKPKDITFIVILSAGVLLAAGICGFYYLSKKPAATTRATMAQINALETQVQDLKHSLEQLEKRQAESNAALQATLAAAKTLAATPAPVVAAPAADPALTAALAALAESQKNQQATLTAIAAQLARQPAPAATSVTPAVAPVTPAPPRPTKINRLELAYKQAWESRQPVVIGQVKNPQSGKWEGGRTLDPLTAQSLGVASWQEWYASEEKTRREAFTEQAARELRLSEETLVEIPK